RHNSLLEGLQDQRPGAASPPCPEPSQPGRRCHCSSFSRLDLCHCRMILRKRCLSEKHSSLRSRLELTIQTLYSFIFGVLVRTSVRPIRATNSPLFVTPSFRPTVTWPM